MRVRSSVIAFSISIVSTLAWANVSGTVSVPVNTNFSFDAGATEIVGGDVFWTGSSMTVQGTAKLNNVGNAESAAQSVFNAITQPELAAMSYTSLPIPSTTLVVDDIFSVHTIGGNYAKALVTAVSGTTITFEYVTYGSTGSGGTPTISTVQNNYGLIQPGLPNYGIAPGSLFFVKGLNLANQTASFNSLPPGLQTTQDGVTVSVTVGSVTKQCFLYYISQVQIDAVLPGTMPVGVGTITVTNGALVSQPAPFTVVQSAFGMDTYNNTEAAAYDGNNALLTSTNSGHPNQTIALWGSGVGADPNNDNKTYPQNQDNLLNPPYNIPVSVYVGGIQANLTYAGPSQYPGVDIVDFTIPSGVTAGCYTSVVVVTGSIVSNFGTIPIATSGNTCPEPLLEVLLQQVLNNLNVKIGFLQVSQKTVGTSAPTDTVLGQFYSVQNFSSYVNSGTASIGSCLVTVSTGSDAEPYTLTGLDAGPTITVTGPNNSVTLSPLSGVPGIYAPTTAIPSNFIQAGGASFTFTSGGGADVQAFSTQLNFPNPLVWTNMSSVTSVTRSQPLTVTWTPGAGTTEALITGTSAATYGSQSLTSTFTCHAPMTAGTFTVPTTVLLAMPPGSGTLDVGENGDPQVFLVKGLDSGVKYGSTMFEQNVTYK